MQPHNVSCEDGAAGDGADSAWTGEQVKAFLAAPCPLEHRPKRSAFLTALPLKRREHGSSV